MPQAQTKKLRAVAAYTGIVLLSIVGGALAFEIYLAYRAPQAAILPFYNKLYPYVMFRPMESYSYEPSELYEMSHFKTKVRVYTNEDGFRIPAPGYKLPKEKPPGQLRIAFLGGSLVQLASTFETTIPGGLKTVLQKQYPGRDIEVINAGIQSSVSRQSLVQLLLDVVDYHPDIVVLYDGGNDLGLPLTYESRANFPYNFQTMEEAWDLYRQEHRQPLWRIALQRSYLYRMFETWSHPESTRLVPTADAPFAGTNALPAERILSDKAYSSNHVAAYLSNWRKLIELSAAYHYQPVCILSPASGGLDAGFALARMQKSFRLDQATALRWIEAFRMLYGEAARQIEQMRPSFPQAILLNLTEYLQPPEKYFWDLAHVYDETNLVLAERIFTEIRPAVEQSLRKSSR